MSGGMYQSWTRIKATLLEAHPNMPDSLQARLNEIDRDHRVAMNRSNADGMERVDQIMSILARLNMLIDDVYRDKCSGTV